MHQLLHQFPIVFFFGGGASLGGPLKKNKLFMFGNYEGRRDALEQRQRELDLRANGIQATEKRVDGKIAELKGLQSKIESLLAERDAKGRRRVFWLTATRVVPPITVARQRRTQGRSAPSPHFPRAPAIGRAVVTTLPDPPQGQIRTQGALLPDRKSVV